MAYTQIVNGTKKWITNGTWSDYFVTLVRTGKGFTVLLIPRVEGVETKPIKTSYSASAGTAFVTFDNVKVPVENILGEENMGMRVILSNFNHERWGMACTYIYSSAYVSPPKGIMLTNPKRHRHQSVSSCR